MTEEEKIKNLLLPRFKIIAINLGDDHPKGKIIHAEELSLYNWQYEDGLKVRLGDFPKIFKKIEWWEKRKPQELPLYVCDNSFFSPFRSFPAVAKILKWNKGHSEFENEIGNKCETKFYMPITESRYLKLKELIDSEW